MEIKWNDEYSVGKWDYLERLSERQRYAIISSYISFHCSKGLILDVGSGMGTLINFIDLARYKYIGIDCSSTALEHKNYKKPGVCVSCSSIEGFYPNNKDLFDVIIFNEVLYYLDNPCSQIKRYCEFSSPGGVIVVSMCSPPDHNFKKINAVRSVWKDIHLHLGNLLIEQDRSILYNQNTNRKWDIRLYQCNRSRQLL